MKIKSIFATNTKFVMHWNTLPFFFHILAHMIHIIFPNNYPNLIVALWHNIFLETIKYQHHECLCQTLHLTIIIFPLTPNIASTQSNLST
jgi:hypothetical protein